MTIGIKIKKLRENARLSQQELATKLQISQTTLCNIESDTVKKIDFALINKICDEFKISVEYFTSKE